MHIDLEKPNEIHTLFLISFASGFLLLLLPFFKKVKFGSVELEREIQETKQEVSDLKTEVRQQLLLISTNINTIGNLSNSLNIYLPDAKQIQNEKLVMTEKLKKDSNEVKEIENELILPYEDKIMSLAQTRIRIEFLLRKILEKRLNYINTSGKPIKLMSLGQLTREFFKEYPQYSYMQRSFEYVIQVTNAGIHAQRVEETTINEVVGLGATLIANLNDIISK